MVQTEHSQELIAFLRGLRAVRQFRADPVPQEVINDVLEVARWSGSASNQQPWELVIIRDRAALQALSAVEGYVKHLAGAALAIVLVMKGVPEDEEKEVYDEGRLSERIMLAAAAHGVGSCIGWFKNAGIAAAKSQLGIPAERRVRTAISLGYPDEQARQSRPRVEQPRKALNEIVSLERYGKHE